MARATSSEKDAPVSIEYDGFWFPGRIVSRVATGVKVRFDVDATRLLIPNSECSSRLRMETNTAVVQDRRWDDGGSGGSGGGGGGGGGTTPTTTTTSPEIAIAPGDAVEIEYDGEWFPGSVVEQVQTGVKIKFDVDGSRLLVVNSECSSRLRNIRRTEPAVVEQQDDHGSDKSSKSKSSSSSSAGGGGKRRRMTAATDSRAASSSSSSSSSIDGGIDSSSKILSWTESEDLALHESIEKHKSSITRAVERFRGQGYLRHTVNACKKRRYSDIHMSRVQNQTLTGTLQPHLHPLVSKEGSHNEFDSVPLKPPAEGVRRFDRFIPLGTNCHSASWLKTLGWRGEGE